MEARLFINKMRLLWISAFFMALFSVSYAQESISGDGGNGYFLYETNCTSCHLLEGDFVGPGLKGVSTKLQEEQGLGKEWLRAWIKDNRALRETGDAYANEVFEKYNGLAMDVFPNFSDQDVDDILVYLEDPDEGKAAYEAAQEPDVAPTPPPGYMSSARRSMLVISFMIVALLLSWLFMRLYKLLKMVDKDAKSPEEKAGLLTYTEYINKYRNGINVALGLFAFLALYGLFAFLMGIGVDKGYQPTQPIYFSHQIHAGVQGIDCQYCHSSAKYSKVSGIPSMSVCMNCHKSIKEYKGKYYEEDLIFAEKFELPSDVRNFYTSEIHKMYDKIGWDPDAMDYTMDPLPLEWTRLHNMPDFVYFSHEQHVVAGENAILKAMEAGTIPNAENLDVQSGGQVCYACHGRVDKMQEVKVANDFTMGWCVECHRTTEVDMDNEYNKEYYTELHDKLKKQYGENARITVDAIGGLECGKCHY